MAVLCCIAGSLGDRVTDRLTDQHTTLIGR